ncbi:MAG: DUF3137 domain-containing protein [Acholeplasmataceae bacterium]
MKQLEAIEEKRLKAVESFKKERNKGLMFLIPAILVIILGFLFNQFVVVAIGFVLVIVGFIFIGKGSSYISAYNKTVKNELVTTLLKDTYEDVYYDQNSGIALNQILKTETVKRPDRSHFEDYFRASYKGIHFETSDLDLKERVQHRDSKGHTYYTYETYFKGRWIIYRFDRHFKEGLKIIESRFGFNKHGYEKMDTESLEFNKKFTIYTTTKEYGFYQITSTMIEKLLKLEKMHRGQIVYCFMDNELHIGINDRKDYLEVSYKTPVTEESLQPVLDDIELIAAIVNEFRLDGPKFKEQD